MKLLVLLFLPLCILLGCLEVQSTDAIAESETESSSSSMMESSNAPLESIESKESSYSSKQDEMDMLSSSDEEGDTNDESSESLSSSRRSYGNADPDDVVSSTDDDESSSSKEEIGESSYAKVERVFDESLLGNEVGYNNSEERLYKTYKGVAQYPSCLIASKGDLLILAKTPAISTIQSSAEEEVSSSSQKREIPWGYCFQNSDCESYAIEMNEPWVECVGAGDNRCGMPPEFTYGPLSNCTADCDCEDGYACKTQSTCQIESDWKECKPTCEILGCSDGEICDDKKCVTPCEIDTDCTKGEYCGESGRCESFNRCEGPVA